MCSIIVLLFPAVGVKADFEHPACQWWGEFGLRLCDHVTFGLVGRHMSPWGCLPWACTIELSGPPTTIRHAFHVLSHVVTGIFLFQFGLSMSLGGKGGITA